MFNIKEFEKIYNLLKENNKNEANKHLISFRVKFALHPDYLFLMSEYLFLEDRIYQAIDTLHTSLLIDYDDIFLPNNPIIKIKLWKEANKIINELNNDKIKILNISKSVKNWWNEHKLSVKKKVKEKINV